uniref:Uncharacterized protein n=1 Tax=Aegilops tauschii subsp. strangulata TaxID=200361 RepID=A0A453KAK6_AEGTS
RAHDSPNSNPRNRAQEGQPQPGQKRKPPNPSLDSSSIAAAEARGPEGSARSSREGLNHGERGSAAEGGGVLRVPVRFRQR